MKLSEYLAIKFRGKAKALTKTEADLLGIVWPPKKGWWKQYANVEITPEMAATITADLAKRYSEPAMPGKRRKRAHNLRGLQALNSGPVKIIRVNVPAVEAPKKKMPAQYRGPYIDPNSDEFLQSYQWRTLRFDVIAKYGNACQCCGATPNAKQGITINVDHIYPRRTHPHLALDMSNLQILCNVCNHGKSNRHAIDFRPSEESDGLEEYSDESISERLRNF
jgi:hypothetical protein